MYNRYIPQPDGTYRRNRVPDRAPPTASPPVKHTCPNESCAESTPEEKNQNPICPIHTTQKQPTSHRYPPKKEANHPKDTSIEGFLQRLLPKGFDTGDLLIVILLLLIAGDCPEDQNSALLTLLLYFFM